MTWWEYAILISGAVLTAVLLGPPLAILIYDKWKKR